MDAAQQIEPLEKIMTDATDDDHWLIGREAAQEPEACKHVNFELSKATTRFKAKNVFWQSIVNQNTARGAMQLVRDSMLFSTVVVPNLRLDKTVRLF